MLRRASEIYLQSRKPKDNFWTEIITRPCAAALLVLLERTPATPNQVTFLGGAVALAGALTLVLWRTWPGLLAGALVLQLAYVLDCADGQLARLKGIASPVGHMLDFLVDEMKAFAVLAAVATRLYLQTGSVELLLLGLWGLVVLASGISITTFLRRPEYLEATRPKADTPKETPGEQAAAPNAATSAAPKRRSPIRLAIGAAESVARFCIHYPSYFVYLAVFDRLDWYLYVYVAVNTVYLGRSLLGIVLALGRPSFGPPRPGAKP